jgi:Ni/Co efflux regulator RcnB
MTLKKLLSALLFAAMLAGAATPVAASSSSHHRTSSTSTERSHKKNDRPKTVHVRSYKKKDGTVVKAHDRAAPESK